MDISLTGAGVVTQTPLSSSRSYSIVLEDAESRVERTGRVVWKSPSGPEGAGGRRSYRVGVAFEDAPISAVSDLLEFIQRHQDADAGRADGDDRSRDDSVSWSTTRNATRYRLRGVNALRIQVEHEYQVRNLSLSGMLIESRVPLRPEMKIALTLDLPEGEVRTVGRVVTARAVEEGGKTLHRAGIEFLEMSRSERALLDAFLARYLS
ncbi:MAG TPA: PilZ domain-containing protein [Thermoanaerobaculia bacterium]|nr:PilZ domain-containing protein [Thermoanaerobaculia bacterium]